jgi:DNA adenine methylase
MHPDDKNSVPIAPLLRWAGSKRKILPQLLPYWERANASRYVEPFVGSAALFFASTPKSAILSDSNRELICAYKAIQKNPEAVSAALNRFPRDKRTYLRLRSQREGAYSEIHRAARFIFLNRNCFNGLYRTNSAGEFNVPYAPARAGQLPGVERIRAASVLLQSATLFCGDFERIVARVVSRDDFVYLDPPYAVANRRIFRQYNATTFGHADLHRLAALLHAIDAIGARFVLSYAVCSEALNAFRAWPQRRLTITRNIAGFMAHRRKSAELLVTNVS